jgi:hypothetical protein
MEALYGRSENEAKIDGAHVELFEAICGDSRAVLTTKID